MHSPDGLTILIASTKQTWEAILREGVAPAVRELRDESDLVAVFFARHNKPTWHLALNVLGKGRWLVQTARPLLERHLRPLEEKGTASGLDLRSYQAEPETYGGDEGMRLTERIYHHDTLACCDLIEAESRGEVARTRREHCLLMVERLAGMMRFDGEGLLAFYERGYRWAVDQGAFNENDLEAARRHYEDLRPALVDLLRGETSRDPVAQWGGPVPARIAARWERETAPLVEEAVAAHASGRIAQDRIVLASTWALMHDNRLGVLNVAEALLRYFMRRLHEEWQRGAA